MLVTDPDATVTSRTCAPTGSIIATLGTVTYPLPLLVICISYTCPSWFILACACALIPSAGAGSIYTVGGLE